MGLETQTNKQTNKHVYVYCLASTVLVYIYLERETQPEAAVSRRQKVRLT